MVLVVNEIVFPSVNELMIVLFLSEMEYTYCSDKKLVTRNDCKASCLAMNTDTVTGWTLACIPTRYHNEQAILVSC